MSKKPVRLHNRMSKQTAGPNRHAHSSPAALHRLHRVHSGRNARSRPALLKGPRNQPNAGTSNVIQNFFIQKARNRYAGFFCFIII